MVNQKNTALKGQGLISYALILSLVSVVAITTVQLFGDSLGGVYDRIYDCVTASYSADCQSVADASRSDDNTASFNTDQRARASNVNRVDSSDNTNNADNDGSDNTNNADDDGSDNFDNENGAVLSESDFVSNSPSSNTGGQFIPGANLDSTDTDDDGIDDALDNCPRMSNANQTDVDANNIGDACDTTDTDADGVYDYQDNCPIDANFNQADNNSDGVGDVCEQPDANGTGLTATYYNDKNFSSFAANQSDSQINFDWGDGTPHADVSKNNFSVRWVGAIEVPATGTYTFCHFSDDEFTVTVNSQQIINRTSPTDHAILCDGTPINLVVGQKYPITVTLIENTGDASAMLYWESSDASVSQSLVPQIYLYLES